MTESIPPPAPRQLRWESLALLMALLAVSSVLSCGVVALWQGVAEAIEPRRALQLYGRLSHSKAVVEVAVGPESTVVLDRDPRPHNGEIAALQKGLIWKCGGNQLIESGFGFGVPVVFAQGQAYTSRKASISFDATASELRMRKVYTMDTIDAGVGLLRRQYQPAEPIGTVAMTYTVQANGLIDVEASFRGLKTPWQSAVILNEQGARYFDRY